MSRLLWLCHYIRHIVQACDLNHSSTSPKGAQDKPERLLLQLNLSLDQVTPLAHCGKYGLVVVCR
jgi:hypothetical protein